MPTDNTATTAAAAVFSTTDVATNGAHEETLGAEGSKWLGEYSQVHMNVFGTPLRVMDHGQGAYVWDIDGNEYLDFLAGIAVNSIGYAHPKWVKAVSEQAAKVAHVSNYFATEPQIKLAEKLVQLAGAPEGSHVYFGNSGAEGNEAAIKLAKLYGRTLPGAAPALGGKPARIIAMTHGFHGRTLGALSATWKPVIRTPFEPLVPNIEFVEAGDPVALYEAFAQTGPGKYGKGPVAAVIMELIQGEAGVRPLGADYVKKARQMCDANNALLIIDEVQTGMGRTGAWFAFQREDLSGGIVPDMITFAKGVAGGFPMGGMIAFGQKLSSLFTPGSHGSTFAGNPLGAAAGLATIGVIEDEDLVANAEARGKQLRDGIMATGNTLFESTRGRGLLDAIQLDHPCSHAAMNWALEHGLIVNAVAPDALRLAPPLNVTEQDVDAAIAILAGIPNDLPND
ncbi:acetylornithine aminotransferase [Bifidobacterium ramosum]|uniref:Acetylornithine aminotransferase n=1 Tax=Bifidobacterium ramosum TaxID=1798158 RepID=A0A6L4X2I3_9BIFI|nr:acetylornithine transaminase [Bifidobacterium ramosum]KAB8288984.1 acetylornithine aminotransferase [Bifidobacterium ramosum]NEG70699.1 acetylornithine transaminase [Bifidobacterium ramosum]